MKTSLTKKFIAVGLSFYAIMNLTLSAFAAGGNDSTPVRTPGISYSFSVDDNTHCVFPQMCIFDYNVVGLKAENISENDISRECLEKTQITYQRDGHSIRIYNPYCSVKVMFAFTVFYIFYCRNKTIDLISSMKETIERQDENGNITWEDLFRYVKEKITDLSIFKTRSELYRFHLAEKICEEILSKYE